MEQYKLNEPLKLKLKQYQEPLKLKTKTVSSYSLWQYGSLTDMESQVTAKRGTTDADWTLVYGWNTGAAPPYI